MKKLLSQIIKWLWDVLCKDWLCQKVYKLFICEILLPVLYSLLFNLSPLIFVVILMAFRENSVWFCIADSVKNGELFLVSLSFLYSVWQMSHEVYGNGKRKPIGEKLTSFIGIFMYTMCIVFIVAQRIYKDLNDLNLVAWVSSVVLAISALLYGYRIMFKFYCQSDKHCENISSMIESVSNRVNKGK